MVKLEKIEKTEDLEIFKKAHKLTLYLYKLTEDFPKSEQFGLTSQIRRAASSICANLMEGSHRHSSKEFRQFVGIANGSAGELKYIAFKRFGVYRRFQIQRTNQRDKPNIKNVKSIIKIVREKVLMLSVSVGIGVSGSNKESG